jgi:hypothetical protein
LVKRTEQSEQEHDPIGNIHVKYFNKSGLAQAKLGNYEQAISDYMDYGKISHILFKVLGWTLNQKV